jgi:hypothetical protein
MIVDKYGNYVRKFMLTVHSRAILKILKSMCNGIKKIKSAPMKCHTNVNYIPPTQLPHKFSYIVAILIHNHFESVNIIILNDVIRFAIIYYIISSISKK